MRKAIFYLTALCLAACFSSSVAQPLTLTIDSCYQLAKRNYPLIQKQKLIEASSRYSLGNASRAFLPQVSVSGQASYQSQTIDFSDVLPSIQGITFPQLSKDQYKIQADVNQNIYDGGTVHNQRQYLKASRDVQEQNLEVNLYAIRERVNQVYFAILLMSEQYLQNDIRKSDLHSAIDKMQAALDNGTAFRSSLDQLKAELVNADMAGIELQSAKAAYLQMLSVLINQPLDTGTQLVQPLRPDQPELVHRPELKLFDLQQQLYHKDELRLRSDYTPRLSAFFQGAYGRPTLNFIDNSFGPWYITGLRLSWNLGSLYTLRNNRALIRNNQQMLESDREVFLFNTQLTAIQQKANLEKYMQLIQQDDKAIELRSAVKQSAQAQLENGVITVYDYIAQLNAENLARQTLILHRIQLLSAAYELNYTNGN